MNFQNTPNFDFVRQRHAWLIALTMAACLLALLITPTDAGIYRKRVVTRRPVVRHVVRPVVKYRHASTIAQGYLDGRANVYRSIGYARYQSALAARHAQAAYEHQLKNRLLRIESYYQAKLTRQKYLDASARTQAINEFITGIRQASLRYRLGHSEYDRVRGTIYWPEPLLTPHFAADRHVLESLFARHMVGHLGKGSSNTAQVDQTIKKMEEVLGQEVRAGRLVSHEFTVASRFLNGLRWEGHFPSKGVALTQN